MPTIFMTSLGCVKNLVDAETMLGETLSDDYTLELDPGAADIVIINTCGFIEDAREESRETVAEFLELKKKRGGAMKVVAMGCLAQRYPERLREEFPQLDAVWGLSAPSALRQALADLDAGAGSAGGGGGGGTNVAGIEPPCSIREGARLVTTMPSYAYLRIADGCDNRCRYCAIPLIRGGLRSREPDAVVAEAAGLADQGAKELVIIAQDTTAFQNDRPGDAGGGLARLLERLLEAVRVPRLRLLYAHPAHLDDAVCDLLLSEPRLCRYIDLPFQHCSDRVLRNMGRHYDKNRVLRLLERFGKPGFTLRTTFLVGFPGETEADFLELLDLVKTGCFQRLGAFAYSPEPGTPAFDGTPAVPPEEAARRRDALMAAQAKIAFRWLDRRVGGNERLLVDSVAEQGVRIARGMADAPDADGVVYLVGGNAKPGDLVDACIKGRDGYDLVAEASGRKAEAKKHHGRRRR